MHCQLAPHTHTGAYPRADATPHMRMARLSPPPFRGRRRREGAPRHPHSASWEHSFELVKDGFRFVTGAALSPAGLSAP